VNGPDAVAPGTTLSIVIITHRRLALLTRCLESVLAASRALAADVVVLVNGTDAPTVEFLRQVAEREPSIDVLAIPAASLAGARNAAMRHAKGDVIYFLDDDVTVASDLFTRALRVFGERPDAGVVGGPNLTPPDSGRFERAVGAVLESPFGSGGVHRRYRRAGGIDTVDDRSLILCNLAIRRQAFGGVADPFPEHVVSNEENILLGGLASRGVRMLHDPDLIVFHARRGTLGAFCSQIFRYGRGRWQNTLAVPGSLSPMFLIPVAFLLYLVVLPFVANGLTLVPLAVYAFLLLGFSLVEARRAGDPWTLPLFLVLFPACHLSYAVGFLVQMARSVRERPW
jgi:GT2 family glycosyltransferase